MKLLSALARHMKAWPHPDAQLITDDVCGLTLRRENGAVLFLAGFDVPRPKSHYRFKGTVTRDRWERKRCKFA